MHRFRLFALLLVLLQFSIGGYGIAVPGNCHAYQSNLDTTGSANLLAVTQSPEVPELSRVILGFQGEFRLGEWAPIVVELTPELASKDLTHLRIWGRDGDDRPVCDEVFAQRDTASPTKLFGRFRLGRSQGELVVEVLDDQRQPVARKIVPLVSGTTELTKIWSPTSKLIGLIGISSEAREKLPTRPKDLGEGDSIAYIFLDDPLQLSRDPLAYRNLDSLLISATDLARWQDVSPLAVDAWRQWLASGGKVCLWGGTDGLPLLQTDGLLSALCPGQVIGVGELSSSAKLEFFVNAKAPLLNATTPKVPIVKIQPHQAAVILQQDDLPLMMRKPFQFGILTFLTLPLDRSPLIDWPGSSTLIEQLALGVKWGDERSVGEVAKGQVSHVGYRDLIGQLRSPLEQFSRVGFVNFTTVAILVTLFVVLVGPVDYWLMRRWLKRPHWTWVSFPFWAILFSALAWWISIQAKPSDFQINQLEIINIDGNTGSTEGIVWSSVYSPKSSQQSIAAEISGELADKRNWVSTTWLGQPGAGFGAMQSPPTIRATGKTYRVVAEGTENLLSNRIEGFPFPVISAVAFQTSWSGQANQPVRSRLKSGQILTGTITNPFGQRILNCRLLFETGAYVFDKPIEAGETVDVVEAKRRLGKSLITRRIRKSADQAQNDPWDPTDTDMRRIAEMLMLHDLAGGQGYTNLTHRYLPQVDTSGAFDLGLGQAILVGELEQPTTVLNIDGHPMRDRYDRHLTFVRLFLPVELPNRGTQ